MAITPTTEQLQIDNESLLRVEYGDTWDKKYRDKGQAIWTFQRRNLSTACVVVSRLHGIDFDAASTFMFHLANNAGECKPIVEAVNSQLELAIIKPDKFIKGLHKFFQELTKPIKKDKQYALYFKTLAYLQECTHNGLIIDGKVMHNEAVVISATDFIMQGTEYLKKQDFDVANIVVGITTENEPIIIRDPFPLVDVPAYYVEALYLGKPYDKADRKMSDEKKGDMLATYYARYGYKNIEILDDSICRVVKIITAITNRVPIHSRIPSIEPHKPMFGTVFLILLKQLYALRPRQWTPHIKLQLPRCIRGQVLHSIAFQAFEGFLPQLTFEKLSYLLVHLHFENLLLN